MKAFLLAAGKGSRLRPITDHTPKCMLPIGGTPLLDLWLDALHRAEVDEVLVNLHHLPRVVLRHVHARIGHRPSALPSNHTSWAVRAPSGSTELGCRTRTSSWQSTPTI
jgi:mannose-1-phosphate guanylyltransferase